MKRNRDILGMIIISDVWTETDRILREKTGIDGEG
jgi:hypothetical protein